MDDCKVKGLALVNLHDFIVERHGEAGLERVLSALREPAASTLRRPFGHEWYPLQTQADCEIALAETFYGADYTKAALWGRFDATRQVGQVYKFLFKLFEPAFLVKKADRLWKSSMSLGAVSAEEVSARSLIIRLSGYHPRHEVICHDWRGSFMGMFDLCGAKDPVVTHEDCRLRGAAACVYRAEW